MAWVFILLTAPHSYFVSYPLLCDFHSLNCPHVLILSAKGSLEGAKQNTEEERKEALRTSAGYELDSLSFPLRDRILGKWNHPSVLIIVPVLLKGPSLGEASAGYAASTGRTSSDSLNQSMHGSMGLSWSWLWPPRWQDCSSPSSFPCPQAVSGFSRQVWNVTGPW